MGIRKYETNGTRSLHSPMSHHHVWCVATLQCCRQPVLLAPLLVQNTAAGPRQGQAAHASITERVCGKSQPSLEEGTGKWKRYSRKRGNGAVRIRYADLFEHCRLAFLHLPNINVLLGWLLMCSSCAFPSFEHSRMPCLRHESPECNTQIETRHSIRTS